MTQEEFNKRVQHNIKVFKDQLRNNEFNAAHYYTAYSEPFELSSINYCDISHDIYASAVTKTLVTADDVKSDAIEMYNGVRTKVELKTRRINHDKFYISKKGVLYYIKNQPLYNLRVMYSSMSAMEFPAYVVITDPHRRVDGLEIIDVYKIHRNSIRKNYINCGKKHTKSGALSLKTVMDKGVPISIGIDKVGFNRFVEEMKKDALLHRNIYDK